MNEPVFCDKCGIRLDHKDMLYTHQKTCNGTGTQPEKQCKGCVYGSDYISCRNQNRKCGIDDFSCWVGTTENDKGTGKPKCPDCTKPKEEEIREAFENDIPDHTLAMIMVVDGIYQTKPNVRTDRQVNGMVNEYNHDYIIFKDGYTAQSKKLEEMSIELDSTIDMRDKFGRDIDDLEQQIEKYTISDSDKSLEIEQLKQHILYLSK